MDALTIEDIIEFFKGTFELINSNWLLRITTYGIPGAGIIAGIIKGIRRRK